ncbi:MAG: hypothetical protein Q9191_002533 [Dirinaria sp. TL-2023a]
MLHEQGLEIVNEDTVRWKKDCVKHARDWPVKEEVVTAAVVIFLDHMHSTRKQRFVLTLTYYKTAAGTTSAAELASREYKTTRTVALLALRSSRWVFQILTITAAASFILLLATSETRATYLLKRRVKVMEKTAGGFPLRIENPDHIPDLPTFIRLILRPLRLLLTKPIVIMVSVISGVAFALVYLFIEVLPVVYHSFGFTAQQSTLILLALGLGFLCTIFTRILDYRFSKQQELASEPPGPEAKLTGFLIAAPAFAIGLWWFAWTVPPNVHSIPWIASALSLIPIGFAINEFDCVLVGYLTNSYTTFASSAFAAFAMLRSALSATFPLFAHGMYEKLGANYATTVLAVLATMACVCPWVLIRYGRRIREASRFAEYSAAVNEGTRTGAVELGNVRI